MKPREAVRALDNFRAGTPTAILRGARRALRQLEATAKTEFMVRGAYAPSDPSIARRDPANPPPGPLKIRSGRLVRTIKGRATFDGKAVKGFLQAGDSSVRYARIHEFGGMTGAGHRVLIRPRPYFGPTIKRDGHKVIDFVAEELAKLAVATLKGLAIVQQKG